jgi:thiol:disulfide interchange protein DsbD
MSALIGNRSAHKLRAHVKREWKQFAIKVAAWFGVAATAHFMTTIFLFGAPTYLAPGILALGALQIGLLDRTRLPAAEGQMLKRGVGLLMLSIAVWLATSGDGPERIPWQKFSDEVLDSARRNNRPVMIDFTSRHCGPCLDMERKVFSNARVADAAKNFLPLRADLTDETSATVVLATKFHIEAFPTVVFIGADGKERANLRLVGFENARFFAERVESAR